MDHLKATRGLKCANYLPIVLSIVLLISIILRCLWLTADGKEFISGEWARVYLTDEGRKIYNARNLILYGKIALGNFNEGYYTSPLFFLIAYLVFHISNVGFIQARLISVAFGILSCVFIYLLLSKKLSKAAGLVSLLILGFNFPFIMYNRFANMDTVMIFFMTLVFYFWSFGDSNRLYYLAAGFFSILAFLVKPTALIIVIVSICAFVIQQLLVQKKFKKLNIVLFIMGIIVPLTVWLLWLSNGNNYPELQKNLSISSNRGSMIVVSPIEIIKNILFSLRAKNFIYFFKSVPVIAALAYLYILGLVVKLFQKDKSINSLEIFAASWLIIDFLYILSVPYQHFRYFLPLIIPITVLATLVLIKIKNNDFVKIPPLLCALWLIPLIYLFTYYSFNYLQKILHLSNGTGINVLSLITSVALSFAIVYAVYSKRQLIQIFNKKIVICLLTVIVIMDVAHYVYWMTNKSYDLVKVSKQICNIVGDDGVILGRTASTLVLSCRAMALEPVEESGDKINLFQRYPITHIVIEPESLKSYYEEYPNEMRNIKLEKTFYVKNTELLLFSYKNATVN